MSRKAAPLFFIIAAVGLMISLLAHVATIMGVEPQQDFLYVLAVLIGIIVFWSPTGATANRLVYSESEMDFWTLAMKKASGWLRTVYLLFTLYASYNLLLFLLRQEKDYELRTVSGYFSVFFFIAATFFYNKMRERAKDYL